MILIIGGAYQGKLDYAKAAFSISEEDVFSCTGDTIDFSKRCVDRIEEFCVLILFIWLHLSFYVIYRDYNTMKYKVKVFF